MRVRPVRKISVMAFVYWAFGRFELEIRRPYYCTAFSSRTWCRMVEGYEVTERGRA